MRLLQGWRCTAGAARQRIVKEMIKDSRFVIP